MIELEIWKDIYGCDGFFQVSNLGNVRVLEHVHHCRRNRSFLIRGRTLPKVKMNTGYLGAHIRRNNRPKLVNIHRLVAQAFIPNPQNKPTVNHIDFDRKNNRVDNLEWCTHAENNSHSRNSGRPRKVPKVTTALYKPVLQLDLEGRVIKRYASIKQADRETGIPSTIIVRCAKGKLKATKGFKWCYEEK